MPEVHLKDKLVAHGEVDFLDRAVVEVCGAKRNIIDLGAVEIAIVERAVDKGHAYKGSICKVALVENATFKVGVVEDIPGVGLVVIGLV